MLLSKEQRIGAIILLSLALVGWIIVAFVQSNKHLSDEPVPSKDQRRTWEQRKDSMRHADSVRYAMWAAEREQRYDSFRMADSIRRSEWKILRQQQYDSFRVADSLWRDSVGWRYTKRIKKDTILDLNHCDTVELQYIRGIGRFSATQIVRYREQLGGFYSTEQLKDEALSKCRLDTLLHRFTVNASDIRQIPVNTCTLERLQRHPYLRYNQAKAIYTLRRQNIRLHALDDLRTLPELTPQDIERISPYLSFE